MAGLPRRIVKVRTLEGTKQFSLLPIMIFNVKLPYPILHLLTLIKCDSLQTKWSQISIPIGIFTVGKTVYSCQKSGGGVVVVVDQFTKTMKKS